MYYLEENHVSLLSLMCSQRSRVVCFLYNMTFVYHQIAITLTLCCTAERCVLYKRMWHPYRELTYENIYHGIITY